MKNKMRFMLPCLALLLALSGCDKSELPQSSIPVCPDLSKQTVLPDADPEAAFTDNLLLLTAGDGNRMLSPYSAKMCLALLANGCVGETRTQILEMLNIADLEVYNREAKEMLERYASYSEVLQLETANSLWLNQTNFGGKGAFLPDYRDAMQGYFAAEVREVTSENAVEKVNAWTREKTHDKIAEILSEEQREFSLALLNAVYFKANWKTEFSEHETKADIFYNLDGSTTRVDFMQSTDSYGYFAGDGVRAVRLDYSRRSADGETYVRDCDFSFYVMVCDEPDAPLAVEAFLNEHAPFGSTEVKLRMPKFELEYSLLLSDILQALGMTDAFDEDKANLGGMIDLSGLENNLFVDTVLQKTYFNLDEKGTEAAAVTAILVTEACAVVPTTPIEFTVNKPFYFAIRDNTSGEILFVGRYETGIGGETAPKKEVETIVDRTVTEGLCTSSALEYFFEDDSCRYYFGSIMSQYVLVRYTDGSEENVKDALANGSITISDLDTHKIEYFKETK